MRLAYHKQKFQDWFTQQWAILWGKRIDPKAVPWLMGAFGEVGSASNAFIQQLAKHENLIIERNAKSQGLIPAIDQLKLSEEELALLLPEVTEFYQKTSNYNLTISVKWNPIFKLFGSLVNTLFSNRIEQLNIPTKNLKSSEQIRSEIITLSDPESREIKYKVWYRTFKSTGQVLYSGVYTTCKLPSGKTCIKAVFPLPKGNATVIMSPSVGPNGELRLNSSGKKFGDPGFYFLLNDSKGDFWCQYIRSFRDQLIVNLSEGNIFAEQTLTLWHQHVLQFNYQIDRKK
ncbi:hypothetical protein WJR50_06790 [Catalinimonas sp. 4WD22]|uniref:hypothetical protein n=1 Tax=Catalinimonas locisalis TaxID=3133978 RepID=UPI003100FFF9